MLPTPSEHKHTPVPRPCRSFIIWIGVLISHHHPAPLATFGPSHPTVDPHLTAFAPAGLLRSLPAFHTTASLLSVMTQIKGQHLRKVFLNDPRRSSAHPRYPPNSPSVSLVFYCLILFLIFITTWNSSFLICVILPPPIRLYTLHECSSLLSHLQNPQLPLTVFGTCSQKSRTE